MAKVTNKQWCDMMNRIHSGRSSLTQEAQKLGISLDELIAMGDETHKGGENERWKEWMQTKRESSKRDKQQMRPRKKKPVTISVPASAPVLEPVVSTPADSMEELLHRKEELQNEVLDCASSLEKKEKILKFRQEALADVMNVLEKVQVAVENAKSDVDEAQQAVQRAEKQKKMVQEELKAVEEEIQKKQVYLVAPWYSGKFPEFGTFFSTVEMEGVTLQNVPEEYLPEASLEGVLLFDFVPDYKKARVFCGLVAKHELEETHYQLLVSDERVKELLKMYIGRK